MEITGRLTANAEVKKTKKDKTVTSFTIAINRSFKQNGERKNITTYIDCSYWVNSGVAEYLKKGTTVLLYGDMDCNAWIDKDGNAKGRLTFHTQNIKFLGSSGKTDEETKPADNPNMGKQQGKKVTASGATDNDDLPF